MATTINADTSNGVVITPDTSGELELQSNGVTQLALTPSGIVSDLTVNGITVGRGGGDIATNTAIGTDALDNNTTGANNTGLGSSAGSTITTGSNNTLIGYDAEPSSATVSNEVTIGNASVDTLRMGNGDVVYPSESGGGTLKAQVYTTSGTWTNPGSVTSVKVTIVSGGGGGAGISPVTPSNLSTISRAGPGGYGEAVVTIPTGPVAVTVGAGGVGAGSYLASGGAGGTSSFGSFASATGGSGAISSTFPAAIPATAGNFTTPGTILAKGASIYADQALYGNDTVVPSSYPAGGPTAASVYSLTAAPISSTPGSTWGNSSVRAGSGGGSGNRGLTACRGRGGMGGMVIVEWIE